MEPFSQIAVTGVGGPDPEEGKPAGTVYICVGSGESLQTFAHRFDGDPAEVVQQATVRALRERLPNWRVPDVAGGVALWIELDAPLSSGLVLAARNEGVYLSAGSRFAVDGEHDRHLRLPFTAPVRDLRRAVGVLAELWPDVRAAAPVDVGDYLEALI